MATTYRYLFADLLTNQILAELPLTGVTFSNVLNSSGSFSGHLLLSDLSESGYDLVNTTIPGRTAIYVDRNGVLVWGGILWTRQYDSTSQTLTFGAREFESYFERRIINELLDYQNIDQLTIVRNLMTEAQAYPNGNIGVIVGTETSGVLVSRTYYAYEYKKFFDAFKDLSNAGSTFGFDFNIDVQYDTSNNPIKLLRLDYPHRGKIYSASDPSALVFDFPSNLIHYQWPENGAAMANTIYAIGPGSNEGKLLAFSQNTSQLSAGYPFLEDTVTYNDIYDGTLLANLAAGEVQAKLNPVVTAQISLPAYVDPVLGSYKTGDQILIRITDDRFPAPSAGGFGLTTVKRITAINVQTGESGPETVTLTLADPPFSI